MYISGQRETGRRRAGEIKIPESYAGNAFSDIGVGDGQNTDALRTAEEAFRRGYVFEEANVPDEGDVPEAADEAAVPSVTVTQDAVPVSVHKNARAVPERRVGGLSGILDRLTTENIILIALILVLWDSKADDELLLMLVILFLC